MGANSVASSGVLKRYVAAFIDLAAEGKALPKVEKDMQDLSAMLGKSTDLQAMVANPVINRGAQVSAIQAIAQKAKFQALTTNFLCVLAQNGRLVALEGVIRAFFNEMSARRGEESVRVTLAQDITAKQLKDLESALVKGLGRDVAVELTVDPAILGGMVVTVGSRMIDDSVASKLERLHLAMTRNTEMVATNENSLEGKTAGGKAKQAAPKVKAAKPKSTSKQAAKKR